MNINTLKIKQLNINQFYFEGDIGKDMFELFFKSVAQRRAISFSQRNVRFFSAKTKKTNIEVPHEIPKLPVIDAIVNKTLERKEYLGDMENTAVIGIQHMLETTGTLFKGLIDIGINPKNMYFNGKCYSTSPIVEREIIDLGVNVFPSTIPSKPGQYHESCRKSIKNMWELYLRESKDRKITRLIILDEGGRCLENMPEETYYLYPIAGIEQTRGGLYSTLLDTFSFPFVDVASAAVKKQIEPPLIAEAVQKEVAKLLEDIDLGKNPIFGVVGNGAIGKGIVKYLLSMGYKVNVYDEDENSFNGISGLNFCRCPDIKTLIRRSHCIFGCTGKDITTGIDIFDLVRSDKIFVSCSSEDKEFLSVLKEIGKIENVYINPISDIICLTKTGNKILLPKGGFPINFNREPFSVPSHDIEVTRGLLFGACIQAMMNASSLTIDGFTVSKSSKIKLDPYLQRFVLKDWITRQPDGRYSDDHIKKFESIEWINENSAGEYFESEFMKNAFSQENTFSQTLTFR